MSYKYLNNRSKDTNSFDKRLKIRVENRGKLSWFDATSIPVYGMETSDFSAFKNNVFDLASKIEFEKAETERLCLLKGIPITNAVIYKPDEFKLMNRIFEEGINMQPNKVIH